MGCSSARCQAAIPCPSSEPRCAPPTRSRAPPRHMFIRASKPRRLRRCSSKRALPTGRRRRSGPRLLSVARHGSSPTCARWRATNILIDRPRFIGKSRTAAAAQAFAEAGRRRAHGGDVRNSPFRRMDAAKKDEAALTLSAARVVNPDQRKPAAWTWTRGGWRDRYPNNLRMLRADQRGATAIEYGLICASSSSR